jgi:hypothetical protein
MMSATAALPEALAPLDLIEGTVTPASLDEQVLRFPGQRPPRAWYAALAVTLTALGIGGLCVAYTLYYGIGTWGNNRPVAWGFGIINFVFWVGIGHAGTLISAILFLFRAKWRNAIARFAEAMTIFAVMCAGIFPCCTPAGRGSPTGCFPIPTSAPFG